MMVQRGLSRRNFLKAGRIWSWVDYFSILSFLNIHLLNFQIMIDLVEYASVKLILKKQPDESSDSVGVLYEDAVVPWLKEVVGPKPYYINQRWVETPDGYIYSPYLQPVRNIPNQPVQELVQTDIGPGLWMETTVPLR